MLPRRKIVPLLISYVHRMKKGSFRKRILVIIAILSGIVLVGGGLIYKFASAPYRGHEVRIYVPSATSPEALADTLRSAMGDSFGDRVYSLWTKIDNTSVIRSGSYLVTPGEKAWRIARRIANRNQDPVRVTFNNIRTINELAARIDTQLELSADDFIAAADSILTGRGVDRRSYPAYFLPDTYEYYWTDSPAKVVDKIIANHDRFWTPDRKKKANSIGLTPEQVATIASIVEEETNKSDERGMVARLYLNRLGKGMKLQADPTVKFAVGDFSLKRILSKHLQTPSPYNTYLHYGLPPGPIRLPSASTLDAVLTAPTHNYIYMCASEDFSGYHRFASDYTTHQANAKRYREALDRLGIK